MRFVAIPWIIAVIIMFQMNVVFAFSNEAREEYDRLAEIMKSNVQVELLLDNSSNILSVIERQYQVSRAHAL